MEHLTKLAFVWQFNCVSFFRLCFLSFGFFNPSIPSCCPLDISFYLYFIFSLTLILFIVSCRNIYILIFISFSCISFLSGNIYLYFSSFRASVFLSFVPHFLSFTFFPVTNLFFLPLNFLFLVCVFFPFILLDYWLRM
jgi:hypothetical protein